MRKFCEGDIVVPFSLMRLKGISGKGKMVLCDLLYFCNEQGEVRLDHNIYNKFSIEEKILKRMLKKLQKLKYIVIKTISNKEIVRELKNKNVSGLGYGHLICSWCGVFTSVLHNHHYPILKSKGGLETVSICANCHNEFHYNDVKYIKILLPCVEEVKEQYKKLRGEIK